MAQIAGKKIPHKVYYFMGFLFSLTTIFLASYFTTFKAGRALTGFSALASDFLGSGG